MGDDYSRDVATAIGWLERFVSAGHGLEIRALDVIEGRYREAQQPLPPEIMDVANKINKQYELQVKSLLDGVHKAETLPDLAYRIQAASEFFENADRPLPQIFVSLKNQVLDRRIEQLYQIVMSEGTSALAVNKAFAANRGVDVLYSDEKQGAVVWSFSDDGALGAAHAAALMDALKLYCEARGSSVFAQMLHNPLIQQTYALAESGRERFARQYWQN